MTGTAPLTGRQALAATLGVVVASLLVFLLAGIIFFFFGGGNAEESLGQLGFILSALWGVAVLAAVHWVINRDPAFTWRHSWLQPLTLRRLALLAAGGVLAVGIGEALDRALDLSAARGDAALVAPFGFSWTALVGVILSFGVLVPFAEEVFYRGVLYGWMRTRWNAPVAAVVSGAIFGMTHLAQPFAVMAAFAVFGAVLAWTYERCGTLWAPFAMHGVFNTTSILLIYARLA